MDDRYLRCHRSAMGHAWDDFSGVGYPDSGFGISLWYRCLRCGTVKRLVLSRFTGEQLASPRYFWPEGYSRHADEIPTREQVRVAEIRAQLARRKAERAEARKAKAKTRAKASAG